MVAASRQEALKTGAKRYHGAPCKNCGGTERYVSSGCKACRDASSSTRRSRETQEQRQRRLEWLKEYQQDTTPEYRMFHAAKTRAAKKGLPFDITQEDIKIPAVCPALGIPLKSHRGYQGGMRNDSPTLDRIVPEKGYVRGNVQVISARANRIKSDATPEELRAVAAFVSV